MDSDGIGTSPVRLQFSQTLSWRAGKPISVSELSKRLKALSNELKDMDQEQIVRDSFIQSAKELASSNILTHKDRGIRALAACCLVDILRLCAPEAPFTASQLRDIFQMFISSIIPALADPSDPYNPQHLYVLGSLSQVKSIILVTDVSNSNEMIRQLLSSCFDILATSSNEMNKNVEYNMTGMLQCVIEECPSLPPDVVDIILAQFLRADPTFNSYLHTNKLHESKAQTNPSDQRQVSASYNMAKNICNSCSERMARYTSQYFSSVIMDFSNFGDNGMVDDDSIVSGLPANDLKELKKAHRLLRELWRASPSVLQNVIPQIEAELQASNDELRLMATDSIGDLVAGIGAASPPPTPSQALDLMTWPPYSHQTTSALTDQQRSASTLPFAQQHPSTFRGFLGRRNDKSTVIRAAWTTTVGRILTSVSGNSALSADEEAELIEQLSAMLVDSEERVRISAIHAIGNFSLQDVVFKLGAQGSAATPGSILYRLAERVKDKKPLVRAEAMPLLGRIWAMGSHEISSGASHVEEIIGCLPSKIFDAYYTNDSETHALIDKVLFETLIPVGFPILKSKTSKASDDQESLDKRQSGSEDEANQVRTDRILLLARMLDPRAKAVFGVLLARPMRVKKFMTALVQRWEDYNGGVMDKNAREIQDNMRKLTEMFAKMFPDSGRAMADLNKFAKLHDRRCYSLIRFCISIDSDYRKIQKALRELRKRLDSSSLANTSAADTIYELVRQSSHLFFNRSHVGPMLAVSQDPSNPQAEAANDLLREISSGAPLILKSHADEICRSLAEQAPGGKSSAGPAVLTTLKACAAFARRIPESIPKERKFFQSMLSYAAHGDPPAAAKYAVSIILSSTDKRDLHSRAIFRQSVESFEYGKDHFISRLAALSQLILQSYKTLDDDDCDVATDIAINKVLQHKTKHHSESEDDNESRWLTEPNEECQAKSWALKVLVNRLRSHDDSATIGEVSGPVYALLNKLVIKNGELGKDGTSTKALCSTLRMQSALLLLKLSSRKSCDALLDPVAFNKLAEMAQDPLFPIRQRFLRKVMKYLSADRLPSRFYVFVFLAAFEPSERLRTECSTWIRSRATLLAKQKKMTLEVSMARFISLLAHHPDFSTNISDLEDFVIYIVYYLQAVATEDNIHLILYIAQRVKSVRDGIDESMSDSLYCLSDLAQTTIRVFAEIKDWSLQAFSGKVNLPFGVFLPMSNHQQAKQVAETTYIPDTLRDKIENIVRTKTKSKKRKLAESKQGGRAKRQATSIGMNGRSSRMANKQSGSASKDETDDVYVDNPSSPAGERRRSNRVSGVRPMYTESDDEDDAEADAVSTNILEEEEEEEEGEKNGGPREDDNGNNSLAAAEMATTPLKQRSVGPRREKAIIPSHPGSSEKENSVKDSFGGKPATRTLRTTRRSRAT